MAVALSKAGADVILVQRDTKNTATKDLIEKAGGKADIVVADLADKESVGKLIPHVTGELGRVLDIVVNCGMSLSPFPWPHQLLPEDFPRSRLDRAPDRSRLQAARWRLEAGEVVMGKRAGELIYRWYPAPAPRGELSR